MRNEEVAKTDSKQVGEKKTPKPEENVFCSTWVWAGRGGEDEEQLSQRQDRQGTASIPGAELKAGSLVSLTISLHTAIKVGGEMGLYIK